jgi:hypothetical protein
MIVSTRKEGRKGHEGERRNEKRKEEEKERETLTVVVELGNVK